MSSFDHGYLDKLVIPHRIITMIRKLGEHKGRQELFKKQAPEMLENLRQVALIQSTESSNRIEGIVADDKRLRAIVAERAKPANRSEAEIAGYRDVLNTIHHSHEHMPFTERVVLQAALHALDPTRHTIIYLPNPTVGVRGIHHQIVAALGHRPLTHHATLVPQTVDALAVEQAERGRTPVLVIDEAHLLDHAQLESIRMLTNHDMDSSSPFACLLVGQPTLRRRMKLGVLAALDQRIALRYAMPPMTPRRPAATCATTSPSPAAPTPCSPTTPTALIHQTSRGYPRAVNNLAVQALVAAFAADKAIVDESSTRAAVAEVTAE